MLAVLALAVLSLGRASAPAGAGIVDYANTLYLSAATSTISGLSMSRTLVTSAGPGTPAAAPTATLLPNPPTVGTITDTTAAYEYTIVDSTGGETPPSPPSNTVSATNQEITVGSLPTGVTVRLYRKGAGVTGGVYKLVTTLANNVSSTYTDNSSDATVNTTAVVLPMTQNKPATGGGSATGFFEFVPGVPLATSAATSTPVASRAFSNKGWVVDAAGGVSVPTGNWTFVTDLKVSTNVGTAFLDIGMWLVDGTGNVVSQLVDPTTCSSPCGSGGENTVTNINRAAVTSVTTTVNVPGFSIPVGDHLYVQYWRNQTVAATGTTTISLLNDDGATRLTHPTANAYPNVPALGSTAAYVNTTPQLSAKFSDSDAADTGTLSFQLCSDPACATVLQSGASAVGLANGATGTWTPPTNIADGSHDGTYYWRAKATDSYAGATGPNASDWSSTSSFVVDTVPPTVSGVTASTGNGAYDAGQTIHVQVGFSEPVNVTGSPKLALNTAPAESATYVSGSGTSTLIFDYTVQPTDNVGTLDYAGTGALTLNGGTIADLAGNNGTLALVSPGSAGSLAANKSIKIDTVPPTVGGITASTGNGAYDAGRTIHVQVGFSEPVNVTGSPKLALNTVPAESATYVSGSGTSTLTFDYTVQAGDNVGTLDYAGTGALTLNGGTIADLAGNNGTLTLVSPGSAGSLAAARSIRIDTNPPNTPSLNSPADASYLGSAPALGATFSNGDVGDSGTLDFRVCSDSACSSVVQSGLSASGLLNGGSGSWTPSGLADAVYYWETSGIDAAGNQSGWSAAHSFTLDTTAPTPPALGAVAARLKITPQLSGTFSDPGGGASDAGTLTFQLCSNALCTVVLQSNTQSGLANNATANWTPTGLADGAYYFRIKATDSAGNSSWSATTPTFTVDTVAPAQPALVSPASAVRVGAIPQLNATFTNSDPTDSGTVTFQLCSDAACATALSSSTSATVGSGAGVNWTPGGPLADGTYYWRASSLDAAGNQGAWSATRSFVLDTNPPGVPSLNTPADAAYVGVAPTLNGTFTSSDVGDSGKLDFQVCLDSGCSSVVQNGSSTGGILSGASGSWTPSSLADGRYFWRSRAQDAAGNQSAWSAVRSFTLDTTPPSAPALGSVAARSNFTPQLSGTFSDPGASDSGTLTFQLCSNAGCTVVLQTGTQSGIADNASANWTPSSLADGVYYFRVRATDTAGNLSGWSSGSFTVDTVPPGLPTLVTPANAVRVNAVPQLNATFVDSDPTDSGTVTFQLCSDAGCASVLAGSTSATVGGGTGVSWTPAGPLADGTYYWRASSLDAAGNQGAWSSVRSFVLDTTGPAVPTLGSLPAQVNAAPTLSASFSDPDAPDTGTVSFQVCSDSACTSVVQSGSSPAGVANGANGSWTATGLAQSSYFWRARAQDAAGNQSAWSATQQFTLDTTPPSLPTTTGSPIDGVRLNQPPTLTAVYIDPSGGTGSLTFELCATSSCAAPILTNSGTTGSLPANTAGSWTPSFLFDGLYYWRVRSVDSAGNASAWSPVHSFTVDATPPWAPVLAGAAGMRVQSTPVLGARVDDPTDPGDQARIFVQVCSDAACTTIVSSGYSGTVPVGVLASWQAPALADGTYYWRALAEDVVGNRSEWSAARPFVVDTVAPSAVAPGGVDEAAVVNKLRLTGSFGSSDPGDTGTLQFQLCADAGCATVVASGSSASVPVGGTGSWAPDVATLVDGVYFWRVRSQDAAGNDSAWSSAWSFTLDQTPPGMPQDFSAQITGQVLVLRWRAPAGVPKIRGYALLVNGKKTRTLTAKTFKLRIHLRRNDRRSFAVAAIDPAGNMSAATRTIEAAVTMRKPPKQIRSAATRRH